MRCICNILKIDIAEKTEIDISTYKNKEASTKKPTSKSTYNVDISTNSNEGIETNEAAAHLIHEGKYFCYFLMFFSVFLK